MSPPARRIGVRDRLQYAFDNTMRRGTPALVAWLAVVTAGLVVLVSLFVLAARLAPDHGTGRPGLFGQLLDTFLHALEPSLVQRQGGSWVFVVTMIMLSLFGLFVVSALIGIVSTGFSERLSELRKGRSFVVEEGHTLILGWSEAIFSILAELAAAKASEHDPVVVILADRDKVQMEDLIRTKLPDLELRVVCRSGSPMDLDDLDIVNPGQARSVIVITDSREEEPDIQVIKTVLALTGEQRGPGEPHHIVAEILDPVNLEPARLVGDGRAVLIDKRATIARLIVQAARQSGVSTVYTELLDFAGDEVYFRDAQALAGQHFGDALLAYEECALIGLRQNGSVKLNPPTDTVIDGGDELVAIAADDTQLAGATRAMAHVDEAMILPPPPVEQRPQRTLVLGFNNRTTATVAELDQYAPPGSSALVVADDPGLEAAVEALRPRLSRLEVSARRGSTTDRQMLESLEVPGYDQAIVMPYSEKLDPQRADARTLVTLLHLRDISARDGRDLLVVSEMLDDRNRELAEITHVDDVIVSARLISLMISQVSENPQLEAVFADLLGSGGSEIHLRPAFHYVRPGRATTFATVVEAARRRGEVAIGYRRADGGQPAAVRVNPPKSEPIAAGQGDSVIVLAEA